MSFGQKRAPGVRSVLLGPFRVAAILAALALAMSLGFLVYTAWISGQRLDPLERHLIHLQDLQQSSVDIQELIIRHFETQTAPQPAEVRKISQQLKSLLDKGGHLDPDTPGNIHQAFEFLDSPQGNVKASLLAALAVIRRTLEQENKLERTAVIEMRQSAEAEFAVASAALLLAPIIALLMLAYLRRRSFRSINQLSNLLENVGNLNFRTAEPVPSDDPLAGIYERYNEMAEKLRDASRDAKERATVLESQVRAASETLLRQQAELENSARLAAIGEFAARLAHELRNPISGISIALRNMEQELTDADYKDRVTLIAEEMDRVTRLLNSLLATTPSSPETPTRLHTTALVGDIIRLFSYQLPPQIKMKLDVKDRFCVLPRDTVRQVLINLLKNSRDAIGERAGTISVSMVKAGAFLKLTVADSGPGYPEDLLKYGIRPFQTGKATGTGLGLSVIKRLVESAGGDVSLASGGNGGAVTVVTLPSED